MRKRKMSKTEVEHRGELTEAKFKELKSFLLKKDLFS